MKVLLISHTVISRTGNMGKTMLSYFKDFGVDEMAQLYIHSEVPTDGSICRRYYRFTDKDAIRSILPWKKCGRPYSASDIQETRETSRTDSGLVNSFYRFGSRRSGFVIWGRNQLWRLRTWKTAELKNWILDFNPDIIFFMSGDYSFMYDIACYAADLVRKPLVVVCVDEYYQHNRNANNWFGRRDYKRFLKIVFRTMGRANCIFTICDKMNNEYEHLFGKPCYTLHTAAAKDDIPPVKDANRICYMGNLGYGRHEQLVKLGRTLKALQRNKEPVMIDVYSASQNQQYISALTVENGIRFHGRISADEVKNVMSNSMAVIHTESFEQKYQDMTRYSVSTKIAESLMSGSCLLAYGPEGIASIDYLKENQAAYVITSEDDLQAGLAELIKNAQLRADIIANARKLAQQNHTEERNSKMLREKLEELIAKGKNA